MCQNRIVALSQAALLSLAALGCSSFPSFRSGTASTPLGPPRPGPIKQLATAVSESKFGKSVSTAFQNTKKKPTNQNDPTALANGIAPTTASDYVALGENLEQTDDSEGARRLFHKALELEPHHLGAFVALGRHFDRQGQLGRATESYLEATKYHPASPIAFNDLGLCYARQRRYDEATRALSRAIQLEPDRVLYRNNIAMVLVAQNRIDEALAHLTDAHGPAIAHYNIGCLLGKQGRNEVALDQFKLALANDPAMERAQEWIEALSTDSEQGEPDQMIASQQPANDSAPTDNQAEDMPDCSLPRGRQNVALRDVSQRPAPSGGRLQPLPPVDDRPMLR